MHEPSEEVDALAYKVIGAAIEVHKRIGPGFAENVYESALCVELTYLGVPFERQRYFDIRYRDVIVGKGEVDILVGGMLVLELKAVSKIVPAHVSQARSYLKALNLDLALLMNFSDTTLGTTRVVLTWGH